MNTGETSVPLDTGERLVSASSQDRPQPYSQDRFKWSSLLITTGE